MISDLGLEFWSTMDCGWVLGKSGAGAPGGAGGGEREGEGREGEKGTFV